MDDDCSALSNGVVFVLGLGFLCNANVCLPSQGVEMMTMMRKRGSVRRGAAGHGGSADDDDDDDGGCDSSQAKAISWPHLLLRENSASRTGVETSWKQEGAIMPNASRTFRA